MDTPRIKDAVENFLSCKQIKYVVKTNHRAHRKIPLRILEIDMQQIVELSCPLRYQRHQPRSSHCSTSCETAHCCCKVTGLWGVAPHHDRVVPS